MISLVKSNSFWLLRAQPPYVTRNETQAQNFSKSTYSLFLQQILAALTPLTYLKQITKQNVILKLLTFTVWVKQVSVQNENPFFFKASKCSCTQWSFVHRHQWELPLRWLIQGVNSSVGIKSVYVVCVCGAAMW